MRQQGATMAPALDDLVAAIERRTGLNLAGSRRPGAAAGLSRAMAAAGVDDHDEYRRLLERDEPAFAALVAELTVGETYFLRERLQLELLRRHILPDLLVRRGPGHGFDVWSAGCATGEEAYTLAMILDEAGLGRRSRVLGTDLSTSALRRAEAALYGPWSLRAMSPAEREAWLEPVGRHVRVKEPLARRVRFAPLNLLDGPPPGGPRFDVVFCRNVLIYLVPAAIERVATNLLASLAPGGWLVTASSDPHLELDGLARVRTGHGIAYRRSDGEAPAGRAMPGHGRRGSFPEPEPSTAPTTRVAVPAEPATPAVPPSETGRTVAPGTAPEADTPEQRLAAARKSFEAADYATAAALALEAVAAGAGASAQALLVRSLANRGHRREALASSHAAVTAHPLDAELRYLQAVLEAENGRFAEAVAAATAALYLRPDLAVAHLVRAHAARALGDEPAARLSFRNAGRLLGAMAADEPVALADGEPAGRLLASVDAQASPTGGREPRR